MVGAQQAEFYVLSSEEGEAAHGGELRLRRQGSHGKEVDLGQGLVGQCAEKLTLSGVPVAAFKIVTGLSERAVAEVLVLPVIFEGEVRGVIELASLERFNPSHQAFLDQLTSRSAS